MEGEGWLKGNSNTYVCHLPQTQPTVGGTPVICVLIVDSCKRDALCQCGVSHTLVSPGFHEGSYCTNP